ncbi:MAG: cupredoxin domain-containing protein [Cryobacterium sp.]|nr:cupredoxin domain-containing protein [Oligoflexia bacterium]
MKKTLGFIFLGLALATSSFAAPAAVKISLGTGTAKDKEKMVYSKDKLTVKAGAQVALTFKNNSSSKGMTHNWVLVKPGKGQMVQDAAPAAGPGKNWTPEIPEVLVKSKLIDAGESEEIAFTAPTEPGDYPFVCTFPGHTTMKGILKVTK